MVEYCAAFRAIEQQLDDMNFQDKLYYFMKPLPHPAQCHVRLMDLNDEDMDTVYQAARQWARIFDSARPPRPFGHMKP